MYCPRCGVPNPDDATFCVRCGTRIDGVAATLPPAGGTSAPSPGEAPTVGVVPPAPGEEATVLLPAPTAAGEAPTVLTGGVGWTQPGTQALSAASLKTGSVLAERYEILALLGEGGMGAVYRARDRELDRMVALKVIRPELVRNEQVLQRFKQEIILARQVTHRNVIRIFDIGQAEGIKYITMEFIEGEDLSSILAERARLPAAEAAGIMTQVCLGLQAAHNEGVVHRDLKPQNIMLDKQAKVSVMDFGIARSVDTTNMTRTGSLLGTPAYMSPEQAQGRKVDARSDLYTLGVIFYELLTGKNPFQAEHPMATLVRRIQEKPVPPVELEPSVPKEVNDIVLKMLGTLPDERYQTAGEILADLDRWDAVRTGRALPQPAARAMGVPVRILIGVMAVMLCVVGWMFWKQWTAAPAPQKTVTMVVADFVNQTRDPVFDGALEATFSLAMEGASFISAFPRLEAGRVAAQLRPGAARLDEPLARLVAIKQGINVIVAGSIEARGSGYSIAVKAVDAVTGKPLVEKSVSASNKQNVLGAVGKLAAPIRKALGDRTPESAALAAAETYSSGSLEAAKAYALAQEMQWAGKWESAIENYQKAVQIDPGLGRAYTGLAVAHANLGQRRQAEQFFQQALARTDRMSDREKFRTRGAYYLSVRNDQKAIDEFSALVKQFPADDAGRSNLALAYFYNRNIARALDEVKRAIEVYPRNQLYRNNAALFAMYAGEFDTAIREAGEVLNLNPAYASAYLAQALSHLAAGRTEQAIATYRKMQGVSARGASLAAIGLADAALYEGRDAEAIPLLEQGISGDLANAGDGPAGIKLAALAGALRDRPKALAAAARALEKGKREGAVFASARVLLRHGQEARALDLAAQFAKRLEPEPQCYAKLIEGEALLARGKPRDAIRLFQEARTLADTWLGRLDLGRAYLEAEAFPEASSELDACIRRRGEATAVFLDDVPSYRYFPPVYYYLARAQEGMKSPGALESYRVFLAIKSKSDGQDPMVADARRRAAALEAK